MSGNEAMMAVQISEKSENSCNVCTCFMHFTPHGKFFFYWICVRKIRVSLTSREAQQRVQKTKKKKRQGGKIVLFTAGPRAPFSPHERGASDEVLIACGHKWFLQTL